MISHLVQDPVAHRFGWALIHFVWQGAVIALLLKLVLATFQRGSSNLRYAAACGAMVCLALAPVVTFLTLPDTSSRSHAQPEANAPGSIIQKADAREEGDLPPVIVRVFAKRGAPWAPVSKWLEANLSVLLSGWILGVMLFSARLGAGWWRVKRMAANGSPLAQGDWQVLLAKVSARLGLAQQVVLLKSTLVEAPATLGWLRPVVLLPASTVTGLAPDQLEWILAHELAHIRRRDYLVNLVQSIAETLLFYHPAVWWVSAQVRLERENCCDDMVVAAFGDPAGYARTLATLEALRSSEGFALAANGGPLLKRVRRLLGHSTGDNSSGIWVLGVATGLALVFWFAGPRDALATQVQPESGQGIKRLSSASDWQKSKSESVIDPVTGTPVSANPESPSLFTRTYKVDPTSFLDSIRRVMANSDGSLPIIVDTPSTLRAFLAKAGVDFPTNSIGTANHGLAKATGRTVFFNERTGLILVRATLDELDIIEKALTVIQASPPQVMVEIKFVELSEDELGKVGLKELLPINSQEPGILVTNRSGLLLAAPEGTNRVNLYAAELSAGVQTVTRGVRGILTDAQFKTVLRGIERLPGADVLAAPRVTTLSGRQARIEVAELRNIVTVAKVATKPGEENVFGTTTIPLGPSIDLIPYVSADGHNIEMTLIPGITAFVGYDDPGPLNVPGVDGLIVQKPLPRFRVSQTITSSVIPDGQTLVLTGFQGSDEVPAAGTRASRVSPKQVLIFVTPVVVDSTGNRLPAN